jgi:hypothetical protein
VNQGSDPNEVQIMSSRTVSVERFGEHFNSFSNSCSVYFLPLKKSGSRFIRIGTYLSRIFLAATD